MKIWFLEPPADTATYSLAEIGRYVPATKPPIPRAIAAVDGELSNTSLAVDVAAWMVPAGVSGDQKLVHRIADSGKPLMISVNGLGAKAYKTVSGLISADKLINLFDAREQDFIAYLEQLAWLSAQPVPFAVMAKSSGKLVQAAAMGAAHLIVPNADPVDVASIMRVVMPRAAGSARPTSAAEVDHLVGRESCLTVNRAMTAGSALSDSDLVVTVTETRGLSPTLHKGLVGRILRYDIAPGEPLTFGHLMVKGLP
jgi:hypothetical protein